MPNTTTLTLNDGTSDKTYNKTLSIAGSATFVDTSASTTAGQQLVVTSYSPRSTNRATTKLGWKMSLPYEQVLTSGDIVVDDIAIAELKITIPDSIPASERARVAALVQSMVADASFVTSVTGPESYF